MAEINNDSTKPHEAQKPAPESNLRNTVANAAATIRDEAQQLLKDNYVKAAVTVGIGVLAVATRGKLAGKVAESLIPEAVDAASESQTVIGAVGKEISVGRSLAAHPLPSSIQTISGKLHDKDWDRLLGGKHNDLPPLHIDGKDASSQHVVAFAPESAASAPGPRPLILTHNGQELELRLPRDGGLPIIQPRADSTRLANVDIHSFPQHRPPESSGGPAAYHPPVLTHKGKELELLLPKEGLPIIRAKE